MSDGVLVLRKLSHTHPISFAQACRIWRDGGRRHSTAHARKSSEETRLHGPAGVATGDTAIHHTDSQLGDELYDTQDQDAVDALAVASSCPEYRPFLRPSTKEILLHAHIAA
jgi:hypothetical protein